LDFMDILDFKELEGIWRIMEIGLRIYFLGI
jgi:hypothetical protein